MRKLLLSLILASVFFNSCKKSNDNPPVPPKTTPSATFSIKDKNIFYLTEPVNVIASYTDGASGNYNWNWGDGTITNEGANASHAYATKGNFTIKLTISSLTSTHNLKVLPGQTSFQIVNNSSFILTYVQCRRMINVNADYDNIIKFDTLKHAITDTIYTSTSLTENNTLKALDAFGDCGVNDDRAFFQLAQTILLEPYQHAVLTLTDDTPVYYRSIVTNQEVLTTLKKYQGYFR
ncbi:MAG TPA: PKD domain-containing protein [Mucilaginibacter sp.]|nr:PKD domain-containing protein [Mucilaginibacter sp.]